MAHLNEKEPVWLRRVKSGNIAETVSCLRGQKVGSGYRFLVISKRVRLLPALVLNSEIKVKLAYADMRVLSFRGDTCVFDLGEPRESPPN